MALSNSLIFFSSARISRTRTLKTTLIDSCVDKEVRELRSKRKILTLKITDYTSSFIVKKFSNGEKDEQVFDAISVGM
ncbi:hypothetical protein EfmAA96_17420 [Enterococcus faecium]|nr:hypothetical protein EfmAA96_17420 [Enterococcus faecium]